MIDAADLELFAQSLQHANETRTGVALDAALLEVGWHDALTMEPRAAIAIQFEQQGRTASRSSALEHVVAQAFGVEEHPAVVLPVPGTWVPPGRQVDDHVEVEGIGSAALAEQGSALVAMPGGVGVLTSVNELTIAAIEGIDRELGLVQVSGRASLSDAVSGDWAGAVDLARLAVAQELAGSSMAMLDLARSHALERVQFGQPIAAFQAVRHRLAESLVAIETTSALLDAAWLDRTPETARMAKAATGRGARTVARHCQQVLAGIGFTTEHPFHRYLRRVLVLDELFGSARTLTRTLGDDVVSGGQLPPLLAL